LEAKIWGDWGKTSARTGGIAKNEGTNRCVGTGKKKIKSGEKTERCGKGVKKRERQKAGEREGED